MRQQASNCGRDDPSLELPCTGSVAFMASEMQCQLTEAMRRDSMSLMPRRTTKSGITSLSTKAMKKRKTCWYTKLMRASMLALMTMLQSDPVEIKAGSGSGTNCSPQAGQQRNVYVLRLLEAFG